MSGTFHIDVAFAIDASALGREAFYLTGRFPLGEQMLSKRFPGGCSLADAINFFADPVAHAAAILGAALGNDVELVIHEELTDRNNLYELRVQCPSPAEAVIVQVLCGGTRDDDPVPETVIASDQWHGKGPINLRELADELLAGDIEECVFTPESLAAVVNSCNVNEEGVKP